MNGSNLTFSMTLLIFMKQSKEDIYEQGVEDGCWGWWWHFFFYFSLLCMCFDIMDSVFKFSFSPCLSPPLSLSVSIYIPFSWISGNHNHLYALRTLAKHAIFIRRFTQTKYEREWSETRAGEIKITSNKKREKERKNRGAWARQLMFNKKE